MSSKLIKNKSLPIFKHRYMLLFSVFPRMYYPYAVNVSDFGSYALFDPLDQANFISFRQSWYVIKVDKREVLRLYFKHIYVLLLFLGLPGSYAYVVKVNNFYSNHISDPLDQARIDIKF